IVSFRPGEQVDEPTCRAIEARLCEGLGLGAHQRVSALHHDTDSLHLHIAINKIHPTRYTIHNPYYDHPKLGQLCTELERKYRLAPDNHCACQRGAACRAADMERHSGLESLLGWIRRQCQDAIQAAQSWFDLHSVLQRHDLALHERGTGFVIVAANGTAVKASSIAPACSRPKLEARLGVYAPPQASRSAEPPAKTYAKQPLPCSIDTTALYARYRQVQQQAGARGTAERAAARASKERQIEAVQQRARLKRASIKLLTGPGLARRMLYRGTSKTMRDAIDMIQKNYQKQREAITSRYQRRTWLDWLRAQALAGDRLALAALRARAVAPRLPGNTVGGTARVGGAPAPKACDSITKNGTVIYRFGATAVRDDGDKLTVSRGATEEGLQAALRMAMQRYGSLLRVGGTVDFRAQVVQAAVGARLAVRFDDALLEHRRQTLLEQAADQIGHRDQAEAVRRQSPFQSRLARDGPAEAGMRRGSGRHRNGP
ncbi:MAG TPA: TraI/MobA(P) family conjugative relaxase, partial [Noviherbaspirillum sp.]